MPCAAPCNRLPCDERCPNSLACGHRCPGLCGEPCPETYCQACGVRGDDRVDLKDLHKRASALEESTEIEQQPSKKLFDAITQAKEQLPSDSRLQDQALCEFQFSLPERQALLSVRLARLQIRAMILEKELGSQAREAVSALPQGSKPHKFFKILADCEVFVAESSARQYPKLAIKGILVYASIAARLRESYREGIPGAQTASVLVETAVTILDRAEELCGNPFDGAERLQEDIKGA